MFKKLIVIIVVLSVAGCSWLLPRGERLERIDYMINLLREHCHNTPVDDGNGWDECEERFTYHSIQGEITYTRADDKIKVIAVPVDGCKKLRELRKGDICIEIKQPRRW